MKNATVINERRHNLPHRAVFCDIGSLRVNADGVELLFPSTHGDGIYKVWILEQDKDCELSLNGEFDRFLARVKASELRVFAGDAGTNETVFEENKENVYDIYQISGGWKIVKK